ncbi:MAG TPA: DUF6326 family protein [Saprospiraceae bacterium]|nr:DUF6326 family protein [Saprospiraceae bacterium]
MKLENQSILQHHPIDIKIKLACLWTSLMFCYIYCDYFELYSTGKIEALIQGNSMLDNPNKVLMAAVMMSVPALMISLSIFLKPVINRVLNIAISLFFTCLLTMIAVSLDVATHGFYIYFAIIEIILTLFISYTAYKWPKQTSN